MSSNNYFDNNKYCSKVFDSAKNTDENYPIEKALNTAHDIRKFEIQLFWSRGIYYWGFIVASFTAYFAVLNKLLPNEKLDLLRDLTKLSCFSKIVLLFMSLICLFFCTAWILVNKGSKFWQKNWEAHIDQLEDGITGKMYKAILNTKSKEFGRCPFSWKAYDYSVTKITTLSSIFLAFVSLVLAIFHLYLLLCECIKINLETVALIVLIVIFVCFFVFLFGGTGNAHKEKEEKKWYMLQNE